MNILNKSWKRNTGIIIAGVFTFCKANGIDLPIGESDVVSIGQAVGAGLAAIGTIHDIVKKVLSWWKARK